MTGEGGESYIGVTLLTKVYIMLYCKGLSIDLFIKQTKKYVENFHTIFVDLRAVNGELSIWRSEN